MISSASVAVRSCAISSLFGRAAPRAGIDAEVWPPCKRPAANRPGMGRAIDRGWTDRGWTVGIAIRRLEEYCRPAYLGGGDRAGDEDFVAAWIGELARRRDRLGRCHIARRLTVTPNGDRLVVR